MAWRKRSGLLNAARAVVDGAGATPGSGRLLRPVPSLSLAKLAPRVAPAPSTTTEPTTRLIVPTGNGHSTLADLIKAEAGPPERRGSSLADKGGSSRVRTRSPPSFRSAFSWRATAIQLSAYECLEQTPIVQAKRQNFARQRWVQGDPRSAGA